MMNVGFYSCVLVVFLNSVSCSVLMLVFRNVGCDMLMLKCFSLVCRNVLFDSWLLV